jgi:exopolyphosphatase/pppGpp-phosphohydrolase
MRKRADGIRFAIRAWSWPMSRVAFEEPWFKEIAVANWVRHKLGTIAHELRVSQTASRLFDLTRKWHALGMTESRLLILAALVHDVGRVEGTKGHAKVGARMVMEDSDLPLCSLERRRLAFLTRHHRGKVPESGMESYLEGGHDNPYTLRILLGLLRAADGLDSRAGTAHLVTTVKGRVISVFGYIASDEGSAAKLRAKRKKFLLLESMLRCEVRVEWFNTDHQALVS